MATVNDSKEYMFVYSEMQIEADKKICKTVGATFACGTVSVNSEVKQFSKMIDPSYLSEMTALYPDTKIVGQGILSNMSYTAVTTI
jgi:hypothetical protein